jgi:hypothetical protein
MRMFRKTLYTVLTVSAGSFAHIKPFPHQHVGHTHPEDIIAGMLVLALIGVGAFLVYKLATKRA